MSVDQAQDKPLVPCIETDLFSINDACIHASNTTGFGEPEGAE